jgi:RNA polymerase sigma-70 factor (ECF subfamily)
MSDRALSEVYEACAPSAFRRARSLLGSDADAWDVVQDVFCRLAGGTLLAAVRERPMRYVYRATTNACLNALQARRVRVRDAEAIPTAPAQAEAVHARDLLEKLDRRLDDLDRRILVLCFHDGLPQEEIAEILGVWRRTVGRRLARLRILIGEMESVPLRKTS